MFTITKFEQFPDEILLLIFRYLSSTDILISFFDLNSRFSQTISGYYQHLILSQLPLKHYNYVCTSILPHIQSHITSLTISNEWTGVLSKVFLNDYGERMSTRFPHLQHLTLIAFISQSFVLFLNCLEDFHELFEIQIKGLFAEFPNDKESETLLFRIFSANNSRLNSILFDDYSAPFHIQTTNNEIKFNNLKNLRIELNTIADLQHLLTVLPHLESLQARIHDESLDNDDKKDHNVIVPTLKCFHLQSIRHWWIFSELECILNRLPNLEDLAINIDAYSDVKLINGPKMFSLLSKFHLKTFHYLLRLHDSSFVDHNTIVSTWREFNQEFVCTKNENDQNLIFYSLPFHFEDLILECSLAKNNIFNENYSPQVTLLYLYKVTKHISEVFPIISKCHRLRRLRLQINKNFLSKPSQQNQLCKVPRLTTMTLINGSSIDLDNFHKLLAGLPNLHTLNLEDDLLQLIWNNQSICEILRNQITHLCLIIHSTDIFQSMTSSISQLATTFSSLKYLYFWIEKECQSSELLIISVFKHLSMWKSLIAIATVGIILPPTILTQDNLNDLHRLLTCLRQLEYLDVETNNEMIELNEDIELIPIITLKYFRLRSLLYSWTLTELLSIFPRIPNVKELIIQISTDYDLDLIHGDQLYEHLSKFSLDKFMFFLQIHYPSFVDPIEILSTWKNFSQEFLCFKTDDERSLVLYSLPFHCPYLILRCSVAKNPIFNTHFGIDVKCLTLFEVSSRIAEIFPIILKCYRMRCLVLQISSKILPQSIQEIQLRKMPFLTFFVALQHFPIDLNDFKKLLEVSTNLYHFALNYEVIAPFLNDNNLCELLGYRMTDLLIGVTTEITSESMVEIVTRLACVCPSLRHLYFHFKDEKQSAEALILSIFTHLSQWKRLISFGVANIQLNSTILSKGIRQWVLENCNLSDNDSFLTDYSANTFRLWL
ncbi:hypothetical protein I4U23_021605 [Adineta vaga]|nr:hypothetical protein I4U23_021605 [Adineta vaga]